jgi:hypothetical protein
MTASVAKYDPFKGLEPMNLFKAKELALDALAIHWTPNLVSSPGLGKSAIAAEIAREMNLYLIDRRVSSMVPEDINGLPDFVEINGIRRATYSPMSFWPLEGDPLPINPETGEEYAGWLLLLDEYNSGSRAMQAATYTVILDHRIGGYNLHPKAYTMCAGNLMTDNAIVEELGTASQSRMSHLPVKVCNDTWHFWADRAGIDPRVKAFLRFKPTALHAFDPNHSELTFPCPRTWETVSKYIARWQPGEISKDKRPLLSGTISTGMAREFVNFTKVWKSLPSLADIKANPDTYPIPSEPSVRHAITGLIGEHMDVNNADTLMKYILRMSPDFQVIALRQAIGRDMSLLRHKAIGDWTKHNRTRLIQNAK